MERKFYLVDEKTKGLKLLRPGDEVKRGSYLVSEVTATNALGQPMAYLLMENPKPATAEIPIMLLTAAALTAEDRARLSGQISHLASKGEFTREAFVALMKSVGTGAP